MDPALVHHYFGTKAALLVAALGPPVDPAAVLARLPVRTGRPAGRDPAAGGGGPGAGEDGAGESLGTALARAVLAVWEDPAARERTQALMRAALSGPEAAAALRETIASVLIGPLAALRAAHGPPGASEADHRLGAALAGSHLAGLVLARHLVGVEPLARAGTDELVAALGPTLDRYLTGELGPAGGGAPPGTGGGPPSP